MTLSAAIKASSASIVRTSDRFPSLRPTMYSVMSPLPSAGILQIAAEITISVENRTVLADKATPNTAY